jgi:hypothetical protein
MYLTINNVVIDLTTPLIRFYEPKYTVEGIYELWNTVSNFWYLIVGFQLLRRKSPIAVPVIMVGIFSGMFHGTGILFWEIMDELSILVLVYFILFNAGESRLEPGPLDIITFLLYFMGLYYKSFWVFYLILSALTLVALVKLKEKNYLYGEGIFHDMIILFAIGKFFWYLEQMGYMWFGHSIWHFCSAFAIGHAGKIINYQRKPLSPATARKEGNKKRE